MARKLDTAGTERRSGLGRPPVAIDAQTVDVLDRAHASMVDSPCRSERDGFRCVRHCLASMQGGPPV